MALDTLPTGILELMLVVLPSPKEAEFTRASVGYLINGGLGSHVGLDLPSTSPAATFESPSDKPESNFKAELIGIDNFHDGGHNECNGFGKSRDTDAYVPTNHSQINICFLKKKKQQSGRW